MKKTLKKLGITCILIMQMSLGIATPFAMAATGPTPFLPTDTPSSAGVLPGKGVTNDQTASPASPQYLLTPGDSMNKFEVQKYLKVADQDQSYLSNNQKNPLGSFVVQVINLLVLMIGSICFLSLVIGGFVLVISNGDDNLTTKGKEIIKYAIIGLAIVLCSYIIVAFVQSLFYELPTK